MAIVHQKISYTLIKLLGCPLLHHAVLHAAPYLGNGHLSQTATLRSLTNALGRRTPLQKLWDELLISIFLIFWLTSSYTLLLCH